MQRIAVVSALALVAAMALVGCSSSESPPNAADRTFLQDMIPHHQRAIAVAMIGEQQASDPRVLAFAKRIVREQTPELTSMQAQVADEHLGVDTVAGAEMALHRITDAQVTSLKALHGSAFDRQFIALNIVSEQGAAAMARTDLAGGTSGKARAVAKGIASAPTSEIPELQALAAKLS